MRNFVQEGVALDLVLAAAVLAGGIIHQGAIIAVAADDGAIGDTVSGYVHGVYSLPAETAVTWAVGDVVYWDGVNNHFTKTAAGNTKAGYATAVKLAADAVGDIKLVPSI